MHARAIAATQATARVDSYSMQHTQAHPLPGAELHKVQCIPVCHRSEVKEVTRSLVYTSYWV